MIAVVTCGHRPDDERIYKREIKTLLNEYQPAGIYEIDFDGTGLQSGVYFYRIISGSYTDTKKMILLK